ncbi:MAG: helix-turn-helix transcriptional regulator [Acidimicrobiaceae bacterium]|nr:helix-turn-helix transcriptional regulator [Acidimicrobiaceae bacterium]
MIKKMGVKWNLRQVMATRGMFSTSDLLGPLAERGIQLSREQVYRLVTQTPQRLNLDALAALCDILDCGPQDLVEVVVEKKQVRKTADGSGPSTSERKLNELKPVRARILRPDGTY